jgi:hypothetical protein
MPALDIFEFMKTAVMKSDRYDLIAVWSQITRVSDLFPQAVLAISPHINIIP